MSVKYDTLFIFEGERTEDTLVRKMENYFMKKSIAIKCVFGGDIYQLYRQLKEEEFSVDIVSLLKERNARNRKELEAYDNDSFSFIYFFFDYDAHATKADDSQVAELISFFDNETENGKLFVSYPMVEAIRHFKDKETFKDLAVKCKRGNCPNIDKCINKEKCLKEPHYKTFVATDSEPRYTNLNTEEIWKELIDAHLCKSNYLINNLYARPEVILSQQDIFEKQKEKFISQECPLIAVLSALPMFLQDFYGVNKLNEKLNS